jgi:hypothetical protein
MTVVPTGCDLARNDLSRVARDRERVTLAPCALTFEAYANRRMGFRRVRPLGGGFIFSPGDLGMPERRPDQESTGSLPALARVASRPALF